MKSLTYGNFQVGIVDNPSIEDKGGFEFASGMDIFSEPGVLKASYAMSEVAYTTGAAPTAVPLWMIDADSGGNTYAYIAAGSKILYSTNSSAFSVLLTNSKGVNKGLGIWNNYVMYAADGYVGRMQIAAGLETNVDDYHTYGSPVTSDYYPIINQGGTLKIGAGRFVTSVDEVLSFFDEALKLPVNYYILSLVEHFNNVFAGTKSQSGAGTALISGASAFSWDGIVLSTGSALPGTSYPINMRGLPALFSDGKYLYAFPDRRGDILIFDGAKFVPFRKLVYIANKGDLVVNPGAVTPYLDTVLFAGNTNIVPGVFQMRGNAICQAFVPAGATPGVDSSINIGFVRTAFDGTVYIGYAKSSDSSYHIEKAGSNRQNNAVVRTLWHRGGTDKKKRWGGVKLNLKPLAANTAVKVEYRTERDAAFTDPGISITSANQDKPAIFSAQPRSREIQYRFTYTTSTTNTPELLSYDPLYEVLKTSQ
jgi:hypothetical protein